MKKVIVIGSGNSGGGAIHDYLLSRQDFMSPFNGKEFRFINDPNGLHDLYFQLYKNFSINGSALALNNFLKFSENFYKSRYVVKNKLLRKNFKDNILNFIKNITFLSYNGAPRFYIDSFNLQKFISFQVKRRILKVQAKNIKLLKMFLPKDEKIFLKEAEKLLKKIMLGNVSISSAKNIVIEQGAIFWNPIESTKFYGDRKIIIVTRDPRGIYWSMKRRKSLAYPYHNIDTFIKWYKNIFEKANLKKFKKNKLVKVIKFENFINNFEKETKTLSNFLNIKHIKKNKFDIQNSKKKLYEAKKYLSKTEIIKIEKNLNNFLQW